jgi:peptidoglycan/xylan/chitin deacetylase (PgdA/CDA1 family)
VTAPRCALALAPLSLAYAAYAAPAAAFFSPGRRLFPAITRLPAAAAVGLTFDDGPDRGHDAFLRELERLGATATFFVTGEQTAAAPTRVRELIAAGHEVAAHGYTHRLHLRRAPWELADDLRRARAVIEAAADREVGWYRPPYGVFALASWREAGRQGWRRVLWSRWGWDWSARATPASIAARIGAPEPGEILLLHDSDRYAAPDSWRATLAALPLILEPLHARGLTARSLGQLAPREPA